MTSFLRSTSLRFSVSKDTTVGEQQTPVEVEDLDATSHQCMDDSSRRGGGIGGSFRMWRMRSSRLLTTDASQSNPPDLAAAPIENQDLVEEEEEEEEEEDVIGEFGGDDSSSDDDSDSEGDDDEMDGSVLSLQRMRDHSMKKSGLDGSRPVRRPPRRTPRRQDTFDSVDGSVVSSGTIPHVSPQEDSESNDMDISTMGVSIRESFRRIGRRFSMSDLNAAPPEAAAQASRRKLPQRQGTSTTVQSEMSMDSLHSDQYSCDQAEWEEERVELMERVEALEQKLETKEAVIQCLLPPSEEGNIKDPTALLKAKVQEQALYIEELEEAQQRPCEPSLWERVAEQNEKIGRMEAEHQYQMQQQLLKQKHLEDLVRKLQLEMNSTQAADSDDL